MGASTPHLIEAQSLPDAYYKLVKACMTSGTIRTRLYGQPVKTLDITSFTTIKFPFEEPVLHPDFPTKELHLKEYTKQWDPNYDWQKQGFDYNYMDRLIAYPQANPSCNKSFNDEMYYHPNGNSLYFINQIANIKKMIYDQIESGGPCYTSNRLKAETWVPSRDLFVEENQPCLQSLQFFLHSFPTETTKGKLSVQSVWRSRDIYSAWNSNNVGLTQMLKKEFLDPLNLTLDRLDEFCASAHIYEGDWESAKQVKPPVVNLANKR